MVVSWSLDYSRAIRSGGRLKLFAASTWTMLLCLALAGGAQGEEGPRVILLPDSSVPMVSCTVIVPAGSSLETPETNGAAHYLEHLLFNGTKTRTREQIYAETDQLGAYNNASTQRERTVFQLLLPSENWREGVELQADMILRSTLPAVMFEKERGIILEELAKDRSSPGYAADLFVTQSLYGSDARALPVLGTNESIAGLDLAAVRKFYEATYVPESMTVVLMGDFKEEEGRKTIARLYDQGTAAQVRRTKPQFPSQRRIVSRPFRDLETTRVTVMLPMPAMESPDAAAAILLADVLAEGERAAVSRAVEAAAGAPISSFAHLEAGPDWSLLTIAVELEASAQGGEAPGSSAPAAGAILAHLADLASRTDWLQDVGPARIDRYVQEISLREKMHYFGLERADLLDAADPHLALEVPRRIQSVEEDRVRMLLEKAMQGGPVLIVVTGPAAPEESISLPSDWPSVKSLDRENTKNAGPAPGAIPSTRETSKTETWRTVRPDGLTLIVHSSKGAETLAIHALLRDRAALEDGAGVPAGTADVIHRMMQLGTESKTKDELRGALARIGAVLKVTDSEVPYDDYYFSPEYSTVRFETIGAFAEQAIPLFAEILWHPRMDAETLRQAVASAAVRARRERESPAANAERLFFSALDPQHPRARGVLGDPAALEALVMDAVGAHHAAMVHPRNVILCVSSSLPRKEIERLVNDAIPPGGRAPSKTGAAPRQEARASPRHPSGRRELTVETGQEQSAIILGAPLEGAVEEPALRIAVAMLSERLADQLRERESLAYSIGASLRFDEPGRCVLMSAGTRPENLSRMEAGMREVAAELGAKAPSQSEIDGARNRAEGQTRMRRLTRIGQAYALCMAELRGRPPDKLDADLAQLRAVSPEQVHAAARRALAFESSIVAIAR